MIDLNRKLPIGIQTFEKIRKENYLYVDKTALVGKMVSTSIPYFLSRPRRFGKSLLISTFEAYFLGRKDLFEGLAISQMEVDWQVYPVFHIDLNARKYDSPADLIAMLNQHLEKWEAIYGTEKQDRQPEERFAYIIERACVQTGKQVVVLVDEYDKPLLQALDNLPLFEEYRKMLKAFYGVLKSADRYLRFVFLTGVTKFSQVSVFSDLNNLDDISMDDRYIEICGITEQEIHACFEEELNKLGRSQNMTYDEVCRELKTRYDGYHFSENTIGIYNPFSLLNTFAKMKFGSYWFETGTPSYLVELLKRHHYDLYRMAHEETSADVLNSIDSSSTNPIPVIYQSGYLTIKGYDPRFRVYRLGFPNKEVEEGFMEYLLPFYANVDKIESPFQIMKFVHEIEQGDYNAFFRRLQSFFADTPYELVRDLELHYQNVLFIVFKLIGFYVKAEYHTAEGRIDLMLQTDRFIYIMEFKLEGTANEALQQIEEKQYALPFIKDSRKLFKIGVNFSAKTRNIEEWKVK